MDRLSDLLASYLDSHGLKDLGAVRPVLQKASAWIRDHLPAHAHALHAKVFKDGILVITSDETSASKEMASVSADLRLYLLQSLPDSRIASVRVLQA